MNELNFFQRYKKVIIVGVVLVVALILLANLNPWSYNDPTERIVVTKTNGKQFVRFGAGIFFSGFFSREQSWPNQLSVSYMDSTFDGGLSISDNVAEIGPIVGQFNGGDEAKLFGIVQYTLPLTEKEMLDIHNAHKTPEALVLRRLSPYTRECIGASAQLMSSEMHYSGGKAQMVQEFISQLRYGSYLLNTTEKNVYDSTTGTYKKIYESTKQTLNGEPKRKFSSIKEYNISVGDAQITDTKYSSQILTQLSQKIQSATDASISKQQLMTAEQKKLTAKAQGEQKLTEIEYQQKQEQTKQVVAAQTQVELAKQDLIKQDIALQASIKEAAKIKTLADAEAYAKQRVMQADGALDKKLAAYTETQRYWASAIGGFQGNLVPQFQLGSNGGNHNSAIDWMQIMGMKAARDLGLNLDVKKD